jgi:hypothetical protein
MKLLESSRFEVVNSALFVETGDSKILGRIESYSCKMIGTDKQLYKKFNAEGEGRTFNTLEALSPPQNGFGGYGVSPTTTSGVVLQTQTSRTSNHSRTYSSSHSEDDDGMIVIQEKPNTTNTEQWPFTDTSPSGNVIQPPSSDGGAPLFDVISRKTLFYLISTLNAAFPDYDFTDTRSSEFSKEPNLQYVMNNVDSLMSVTATEHYGKVRNSLWSTLTEEIVLPECDIYSYNPDYLSDPFGEDGNLWSFNYFFYNRKLKRIVFFTCRALSPFSQTYFESGENCPEYDDDDEME